MTTPTTQRWLEPEHPLWRGALLSLAAAAAWLVATASPLPSADLPQHLALVATLADWPAQAARYEWVPGQLQNVGYAALGAALAKLCGGAERGHAVLLGLLALAWPWGLWRLARALRRDERAALAAVPLFFGQVLLIGLLPYLAGLTLLPFVLAAAVEQAAVPRWGRFAALSAGVLAIFALHLSVIVLLVPAVAVIVAWRRAWRFAAWGWLWPLLPAGLHWLATSGVVRPAEAGFTGTLATDFHTPLAVLRWLPSVLADLWTTRAEEACSFVALGAVAVAIGLGWRQDEEPGDRRLAMALAALAGALCFAMPYSVGWLFVLNQRYAMAAAALVLVVAPRRATRAAAAAFCVAFAAASAHLAVTAAALERFEAEAAPIFGLVERLPVGARLLSLASEADSTSAEAKFLPFHHAGAWARVRRGAIVEPSFVMLPQSAVRYRAAQAPPAHPHDWEWDVERYPDAADTAYFDHLLLRARGAPRVVGPAWVLVAAEGGWSLYRRAP